MPKITVILNGKDAKKAFDELISNAEYDKMKVIICVVNEEKDTSFMVYAPEKWVKID